MTPLNERPTPETDHFDNLRYDSTKLFRHARKMEQERDEARRSLAERTEERDKLIEMRSYCMGILREAGHDEAAPIEALVRSSIAYASRMESERDTALAKLDKCRDALNQIAESGRGNTVWAETRPAQIARTALEQTK
jgi:hypothetical protein